MKAVLREYGAIKPEHMFIYRNAVAAGKVLVDLLAEKEFAEFAIITMDFEGDGFTPVMEIVVTAWRKWLPSGNIQCILNLDMEDAFGLNNMDNALLRQIVRDIEEEMRNKEEWLYANRQYLTKRVRRLEIEDDTR